MSVRFELTVRIHPLDDVAKKEGVRRETEPVVKAAEIPRNPSDDAMARLSRDDRRNRGIVLIDVHQFRWPDHRWRDEGQRRVCVYFSERAVQ